MAEQTRFRPLLEPRQRISHIATQLPRLARLAAAGHTVVAPLKCSDYSGLRGERVAALRRITEVVEDCPLGSPSFLDLASTGSWDVLCQHAARAGDYHNPGFDVLAAVAENTHNAVNVVKAMSARGLASVVLTGSIFEQDECAGDTPLSAFSARRPGR